MKNEIIILLWSLMLLAFVCLFYIHITQEDTVKDFFECNIVPPDMTFLTGKFYYTNQGKAGLDNDVLWVSVNGTPDTGQWAHLNHLTFYGMYEWEGYYCGGNNTGWGIQGLVDLDVSKYVAFENLYEEDRLRCITYNKSYSTSQFEPEEQTNVSKPINGWHNFKIVWTHSYVEFYLDEELIATHTEVIPIEPLYFHQQVCVAPWENSTVKLLVMMKDVRIRSDYLPFNEGN